MFFLNFLFALGLARGVTDFTANAQSSLHLQMRILSSTDGNVLKLIVCVRLLITNK